MRFLSALLYPGLRALLLLCGALVCVMAWAVFTESGSRRLLQIAFAVAGSNTEISVRASDGNIASGMRLQDLRVSSVPGGFSLEVQDLAFSWQPWELLRRRLSVSTVRIEGLRWQSRSVADPTAEAFDANAISGWFEAAPLTADFERVELLDLQLQIDDVALELPRIGFSAAFSPQELDLTALLVEAFDAHVEGSLALQTDLSVRGQLDWNWRGVDAYAGALQVSGSLLQMQLQHELQLPAQVQSEGAVTTGLALGQALGLDLQHSLAALDLAPWGQPDLSVSALTLSTRGTPAALDLELSLQATYRDLSPLQLNGAAVYSPPGLELSAVTLDSDELSLQVAGAWDFTARALELDWALSQLDIERGGFRLADVSGDGSLSLDLGAEGLAASIAIGPVAGSLNDQALAIEGELVVQDSLLESISLQASNADNRLSVEGTVQPTLDLSWTLEVPELAQLHPDIGGQLAGEGDLLGSIEAPLLTGSLQGRALSLVRGGVELLLQDLNLEAVADGTDNALDLTLANLSLERDGETTVLVETGSARLNGSPAAHDVVLELQGMDSMLSLAASGSMDGADWQGRVARVAVESPFGPLALIEPVELGWQDKALQVDEHCWSATPIGLCLSVAGSVQDGYAATVEASGIPLEWLNRRSGESDKPAVLQELQTAWNFDLPEGVAVQGEVALSASISGLREGSADTLQAELRASELQLQLTLQPDAAAPENEAAEMQRFAVEAEPLGLRLLDGVWRSNGSFTITQVQELEAADDAVLQGTLSADVTMDTEERLGGIVQLAFADLAFVETMVPGLRQPSGRLQGAARLSGTLAAPEIQADVAVSEGAFSLPALGIDVRDFGANIHSANDELLLDARGTSGDGELLFQASVLRPLSADREFSARLEGSNFRLLETASASATITPSVDLRFARDALELEGSIMLADASLDLESVVADIAEGGVDVSRDAIVVQPDDTAQVAEHRRTLPFDARLEILLGDAVRINGFGLDAALNGELRLEQEAGRPLLAYGELGIPEGIYRIYNQELNARDGRLLFYGNPLNPVLDVRAFRETPTAEVGMMLSGTIGKLQTRLYSTPTLPENEILAILITGKSFNNMNDQDNNALLSAVANLGIERGEGLTSKIGNKLGLDSVAINGGDTYLESSLGLGKYITPDLLMRYEIGLFDRQAVLSIDYSLTDRIKLEVRSGISQSVDISYMIEKD